MPRASTFILTLIFFLPLAACSDNFSSEPAKPNPTGSNSEETRVLRLVFRWSGDDFASRQDLETRSKMEAQIAERGVGHILRTGSGMGWMDILIAVADPVAARKELEAVVASVAPEWTCTIQTGAPDDK